MEKRSLVHGEVSVSKICLGTMTWGKQNSQEDAFSQIEMALDYGVNFLDTAELYAIPPRAETYGATEQIIGQWLQSSGRRDEIVLASKIAGPGEFVTHIRHGKTTFNKENITVALHQSLERLQTDYLDLYQLHWPTRESNYFSVLGYPWGTEESSPVDEMLETLQVMDELIKAGKIKSWGLSNESAWGAMKYIQLADQHHLPRPVSIQNPYSLLNRSFEVGLAEVARWETLGLLAYSPLGFGVLSGKYLHNAKPEHARLTIFDGYTRYTNPEAIAATEAYAKLARQHDLSPAQMALAFVTQQPFVTATIIGATTLAQLEENLQSHTLVLSSELIEAINAIHKKYTMPSP